MILALSLYSQHDVMHANAIYPFINIETPELLRDHYAVVQDRWSQALTACGLDLAILHAGSPRLFFEDDQGPEFRANPHLLQWVPPEYAVAESCMLLEPNRKACLLFFQPEDYWHATPQAPEHLAHYFDIKVFPDLAELINHRNEQVARRSTTPNRVAYVGDPPDSKQLKTDWQTNPPQLIQRLQFPRASKTEYELAAMRNASIVGALGHSAAAQCFVDGGSEFEVHMAYLTASGQNENALPYGNIVAQNEHAAFLHYQFQQRSGANDPCSLLIDAGGAFRGYASDITRSYLKTDSAVPNATDSVFLELLERMQTHQDGLIEAITPGQNYISLQQLMHQQLAEILTSIGVLRCSAAEAFEAHLTETFCPHGLGHLLGLQVHDVGGHQVSATGDLQPPPENYPSLRFTRPITEDMVLTVEPGVYFIPALLNAYQPTDQRFNWDLIELLKPYGGIRIEDNVRVHANGIENLTRDAFSTVQRYGDER